MTRNCNYLIPSRKFPPLQCCKGIRGELIGLNEFIYNKNALNTLVNYDKNHN